MANVNIKFNNKEFLLSCEDGQEEHLEELAYHLNEKFNNLKSHLGMENEKVEEKKEEFIRTAERGGKKKN